METKQKLLIGAVLIGVLLFTNGLGLFNPTTTGLVTGEQTDDTVMAIPLSGITQEATWYEFGSIRFFAVKASDGTIKTGFDSCDVCYASNKGYRQEGDYMICNNCGNRYPIIGLGTENKNPGGCWPGYLPSAIDGDNLVIKESDLQAGAWRFA